MSNGTQMKQAIAEATAHISRHGWKDVDFQVVMLAGFGFLAEEVKAHTFYLRLDGKKFFALGMALSGIGIAVAMKVVGL